MQETNQSIVFVVNATGIEVIGNIWDNPEIVEDL